MHKNMTNTKKLGTVASALWAMSLAGCAVDSTQEQGTRSQAATESDCSALQTWVGNDWQLQIAAGEVIEHLGDRYQSNVDIDYPNDVCAPDDPAGWCAHWFSHVGACGEDSGETCDDGIQNQDETGVDCGGPCDACDPTETCDDGIQNQDETGVDCGGPCDACDPTETCDDGIQNQGETGVDCGGPCSACSSTGGDCSDATTWVSNDWRAQYTVGDYAEYQGEYYRAEVDITYANADCVPDAPASWCAHWFTPVSSCDGDGEADPTCNDGIQNQGETGVDCGGPCAACPSAETCDDGIQNQGETGVDCGGPCDACPSEETCDDGVQNQGETGVDCGGPCSACGGSDGPVSYYGELFCGPNGKIHGETTQAPAQVRGMSFFWSNWTDLWRTDVADQMIDELNSELIRLPFGIDGGTPYNPGDEAKVEMMVEHAIQRGVYVIIDWHAHAAETNTPAAKEFFDRMAQKYGAYDNVIFEIFNEPEEQSWSTVKSYAEEVISVIRQHSDNLVIVGTPHWAQDVDVASTNPVDAENVAYAIHFYTASHGSWERSRGDTALGNGVCLFASEWGATHYDGGQWVNGNAGVEYTGTQEWMDWLDQNDISWANWSVMNKEESSSIFEPGTETLSESGEYLKSILGDYATTASWR